MKTARRRTTGIGSLPFTDRATALAHVFARYELPFYPQLPQVEPDPVPQFVREVLTPAMLRALREKGGAELTARLREDDASAVVAAMPGYAEFLARAQREGRGAKGQLVGPRTLAAYVASTCGKQPGLRDACWDWTIRIALAYARELSLVLLDDALLMSSDDAEDLRRFHALRTQLQGFGVALGLHCCAPLAVAPALARFPGSCLAFDLSVSQGFSAALRPHLLQHFATGGGLSLGVVDTRRREVDAESALASMRDALAIVADLAEDLGDVPEILLTGGCGTGLHDVAYEEAVAAVLSFGVRNA